MNKQSLKNKANKTFLSFDDVFEIKNISDVKLSPDGNVIACVITISDLDKNVRKERIALISTQDKEVQFIAEGGSPCWSPQGDKIAYQAKKKGRDGIWICDIEADDHQFLVPIYGSNYFLGHEALKNFEWSPDGEKIAYLSTKPYSEYEEKPEVKVFNRLLYKSKGGRTRSYYSDHHFTHLWVVSVEGGEPELLMTGKYNEHSISWAPDNQHIAFISNRTADPETNHKNDLWIVNIKDKHITRLTNNIGTALQPAWSPDGKDIAFLAILDSVNTKDSPADDSHLYIISSEGGEPHCLTDKFDRRITNVSWHPNGEELYFTAGNQGSTNIYKFDKNGGKVQSIIDGSLHILEYSFSHDGNKIAYIQTYLTRPDEIFLFDKESDKSVQITDLNTSFVNEYIVRDAEMFWFKSFDQTRVQGWLMKPAAFDTSQKYPLILVIHGGPHNMFGYEFEARMQLLAGNGYSVLFINPRGSSGYGQDFSRGTLLNWGGCDYKDLMHGVDYVLDHYDWIDEEKLGVTGQSYGGYMTNWIITQTERFKAAIVDGGISNLISFSGTSLFQLLTNSEFNGHPWDNYPLLWQWSPLRNVKNVSTPTLFFHGKRDNEVPVSQAEEMYSALKKRGIETTFVQYMKEGHGWRPDLKPQNRRDLYERMIGWFDKYIK
jgi:dipeptidyl aminopeptidase/acylaminoacyl peptidase